MNQTTVLVVDDEPPLTRAVLMLLRVLLAGATHVAVNSAEAAIAAELSSFNVVLLDSLEGDWKTVMQKLVEIKYAGVLVCISSKSEVLKEMGAMAADAGIVFHSLDKPFGPSELKGLLDKITTR